MKKKKAIIFELFSYHGTGVRPSRDFMVLLMREFRKRSSLAANEVKTMVPR